MHNLIQQLFSPFLVTRVIPYCCYGLRLPLPTLVVSLALFLPSLTLAATSIHVEENGTPAAFSWYQEKAEQGDAEAQYNLGVMRETGWSVSVDAKKAVRWYREAAKQAHADAKFRLGMLYYLGIGARQSDIKGQKWIRAAAKQNHPLAKNIYQKVFGDDVPEALSPKLVIKRVRNVYLKNESRALALLTRLVNEAKRQDVQAEKQKQAGTIRERRVQRLTEGAAKPGFPASIDVERIENVVPSFLSDTSMQGNRSSARGSVATIRGQAEKGVASAQYNLGRMYQLGDKLPADKKIALDWYEKSAKQSYADAEYRLGIALLYGVGVDRDDVQGKKWLILAAEHKHPVAEKMIEGLGKTPGSENMSLAVSWYIERAVGGDAQASFHLGKLYQYGWGVVADNSTAFKWYQRASVLGFEDAEKQADILWDKSSVLPMLSWENNSFETFLEESGLPVWLAHPVVIVLLLVILLWLVFLGKGVRNKTVKVKAV